MDDDNIGNRAERKVTAALTTDPFDKLLSGMIGLPNGAHTKPAVVQAIDFYGNAQSYIIQTVRTDETITAFVTQVSAAGSSRTILPAAVLSVIDRQRASITTKLRRRHGKRIAEERMAAGHAPGFMRARGNKMSRRPYPPGFVPLVDHSNLYPPKAEAVTFNDGGEWRAVVDGVLQRPAFNNRGAALAFAQAVAEGKRKAEPVA